MADNLSNQGAGRYVLTWLALLCLAAALLLSLSAAKAKVNANFNVDDYSQIRVVLSDSKTFVEVGGALSWQINGKYICDSTAVAELKLVDSDTVKLVLGKKGWSSQRIVAVPKKGYIRFGGKEYRGRMEFYPSRDGDTVIALNVLPLEDYLLGVVPSEMPPAWPAEALKSQAVAARTYAVFEMREKRSSSKGYTFDVYPDTSDQVYKGVSGEDPRATKAVQDTAGVILTYQGKPIFAQFCADCGGSTKCGTQPYLQAVPCYAPDSPYNDWSIKLSPDKLASLAKAAGGSVGAVREVRAENDQTSGHLKSLSIVGDGGSQQIGGNKLREMLGLSTMKSTRAYVCSPGGATLQAREVQFSSSDKAGAGKQGLKNGGRQPQPHKNQPLDATDVFSPDADADVSNGQSDIDGDGFIPDEPAGSAAKATAMDSDGEKPATRKSRVQTSMTLDLPRLLALDDSTRPVVLYGTGVADMKLRNAYVFDGQKMRKSPKEISVLGTETSIETVEYDIELEDDLTDSSAGRSTDAGSLTEDQQEDGDAYADLPAEETLEVDLKPVPAAKPQALEPRFELTKAPKSEIPPSSRVKVGRDGIELRGSGYGHGVGLSQWGARELATQGLDYLSILLHFYSGVEVFTIPASEAPVGKSGKAAKKKKKKGAEEEAAPGESVDVFYKPFER